jgi:hypothetical protein
MRRIPTLAAAAALATASPLILTTAAHAGIASCNPGYTQITWSSVSSPWQVTHATGYENAGTTKVTWTRTAAFQKKLTASISITAGATVKANTVINSLEAHVSTTLAAAGEVTSTTSETYSGTIPAGHTAIFFAGNRQSTGTWVYKQCGNDAQMHQTASGTAKSWQAQRGGVVDCSTAPSSTSLAYVAKAKYC